MMAIRCMIAYNIHKFYQYSCLYLCTSGLPGNNDYDKSVTTIPRDTIELIRLAILPVYIGCMDERHDMRGVRLDSWNYTFRCSDGEKKCI